MAVLSGYMRSMSRRSFVITPDLVLRAYRAGMFPMAESREGRRLYWLDPEARGIIPLDDFHLPRLLKRTVLSNKFEITLDRDFPGVIAGCAGSAKGREDTWINPEIESLFTSLHEDGHAHSLECRIGGELVGGLYGVTLGGAYFGESMFSRVADASKVALVYLVAVLRSGGFGLLDTQFVTPHLARFGAREIPRDDYRVRLVAALDLPAVWPAEIDRDRLQQEIARFGVDAGE